MPITVAVCCCDEDGCCQCILEATATARCEGGSIACPDEEIIAFAPPGCDGLPDPNPGPASLTVACYEFIQDRIVTVSVPYYLNCNGNLYEFQWWEKPADDCLEDPGSHGWTPFTGSSQYGCSFNSAAEIEFCNPAVETCNLRIDARYRLLEDPSCDFCSCNCLGCYYNRSPDPGCEFEAPPPGCIPPCRVE